MTGSAYRGRGLALGLLALLAALVAVGPVAAYLRLVDAGGARLAQREALLLRYRALAHAAEPAPAQAQGAPLLFTDAAEGQALAVLQQNLKSAAAAHRVEIRSLQVLRGEMLEDAARIGVRIRAAGDVAAIAEFLYALETARPILYPDNLEIRAAGSGITLEFQLDISGFRSGTES